MIPAASTSESSTTVARRAKRPGRVRVRHPQVRPSTRVCSPKRAVRKWSSGVGRRSARLPHVDASARGGGAPPRAVADRVAPGSAPRSAGSTQASPLVGHPEARRGPRPRRQPVGLERTEDHPVPPGGVDRVEPHVGLEERPEAWHRPARATPASTIRNGISPTQLLPSSTSVALRRQQGATRSGSTLQCRKLMSRHHWLITCGAASGGPCGSSPARHRRTPDRCRCTASAVAGARDQRALEGRRVAVVAGDEDAIVDGDLLPDPQRGQERRGVRGRCHGARRAPTRAWRWRTAARGGGVRRAPRRRSAAAWSPGPGVDPGGA